MYFNILKYKKKKKNINIISYWLAIKKFNKIKINRKIYINILNKIEK